MSHIIKAATRGDPKGNLDLQLPEHRVVFAARVLEHPLGLCDLQKGFVCDVSELVR